VARILVIEDHDSIRQLLCTVLKQAGHTVTEAPDGRQGLALYQAQPADLVITDLHMPELNGLDLILELTRAFLHVKVIAISGTHDPELSLDRAKLLGARRTLQKPFGMDALLKIVQHELEH